MAVPMCDRPLVEIGPPSSKRARTQSEVWPWVSSRHLGFETRWVRDTLFTLEPYGTAHDHAVWRPWHCPHSWYRQWRERADGRPGAGPGGRGGSPGLGPATSGTGEPTGVGTSDVTAGVGGLGSGVAPCVTGAEDAGGGPRPGPSVGAGNSESRDSEDDSEIDAIFAEALHVGSHSD